RAPGGARHGCDRGSGEEEPEPGRKADASQRDQDQERPEPVERAVDLVERSEDLECEVGPDRKREHPDMRPRNRLVLEKLISVSGRDLKHATSDRNWNL